MGEFIGGNPGHFAKFNGHKPCDKRDRPNLVWHVTIQAHIVKGTWNYIERSCSLYEIILPNLVAVVTRVMEIKRI